MIKKLEWDSSFFGYSVGQAIVKAGEITNEQNLLNEAENYKLVYVVSGEEIILPFARLKFVDTKTTLIKEGLVKENCYAFNLIEDLQEHNEKLEKIEEVIEDERLEKIAKGVADKSKSDGGESKHKNEPKK